MWLVSVLVILGVPLASALATEVGGDAAAGADKGECQSIRCELGGDDSFLGVGQVEISAVEGIVALLNMWIVVYVVVSDRRYRRREKMGATRAIWLREYVVSPNLNKIARFFNSIDGVINDFGVRLVKLRNENASFNDFGELVTELSLSVSDARLELNVGFLDLLGVIEREASEKVCGLFDEVETCVASAFEEAIKPSVLNALDAGGCIGLARTNVRRVHGDIVSRLYSLDLRNW